MFFFKNFIFLRNNKLFFGEKFVKKSKFNAFFAVDADFNITQQKHIAMDAHINLEMYVKVYDVEDTDLIAFSEFVTINQKHRRLFIPIVIY